MEQVFFSPKEVAQILGGYHVSTIYRMIQSGEMPAKIVRGRIRVHRDTIDDFAQRQPDVAVYQGDPKRLETRTYNRSSK